MKIQWIRRHEAVPHVAHGREENGSSTLCNNPLGANIDAEDCPLRCFYCERIAKQLETSAGELVWRALGTINVPAECWSLATYAAEQNSKLATELAAMRERIDALYRTAPGG